VGSNLTARQTYELIIPVLINAGMLAVCRPLFDFLTVALVHPTSERSTPLTVQQRMGKSGCVPATSAISHRREHVLYRDLLGLRPSLRGATSDPGLLDVARGVGNGGGSASGAKRPRGFQSACPFAPLGSREVGGGCSGSPRSTMLRR
jgi:hypothetical protein